MDDPSSLRAGDQEIKVEMDADGDASSSKFQVNMGLIPSAIMEEEDDLKALNIGVFNQEDLEQGNAWQQKLRKKTKYDKRFSKKLSLCAFHLHVHHQ